MRLFVGLLLTASCVAGCSLLVDSSGLAGAGGSLTSPDAADAADAGEDVRPVVDASDDAGDASDGEAPAPHPYVQAVLADSPALYYRLEETSDGAAKDETGNHPGVYVVGGVHSMSGAFPGSNALGLSGTGGIDPGDIFDFEGTTAFTLEAWFRPDAYDTQYRFLFHHNDETDLRQNYGIYVHRQSGLAFERYVDGNGLAASVSSPSVGAWHHVVGVYTGSIIQLFVDGTLVSSVPDTRAAKEKRSILQIGFGWGNGEGAVRGTLDEVAVYERALGQDRIEAHFQAAK